MSTQRYRRIAIDVEAVFEPANSFHSGAYVIARSDSLRELIEVRDFERHYRPICPACNGAGYKQDGYICIPCNETGILPWPEKDEK